MHTEANRELLDLNLEWLRQVTTLIETLDEKTFATSPSGLAPHRVGAHLRHILEFYECFLDGLAGGRIDYDQRKRDESIERNPTAAVAKIRSIARRLERTTLADTDLLVHIEDGEADAWLRSSVGRELQALSSHTIHHFALIAVTLRVHGVAVHPDFGMSPATLRFQATKFKNEAA